MELKPSSFARRSLFWAALPPPLGGIPLLLGVHPLVLYYGLPLAMAAWGVGALHGLAGLWWDDARACAITGSVVNLAGFAVALWLFVLLPSSGWG